jgi:hypothetical protein
MEVLFLVGQGRRGRAGKRERKGGGDKSLYSWCSCSWGEIGDHQLVGRSLSRGSLVGDHQLVGGSLARGSLVGDHQLVGGSLARGGERGESRQRRRANDTTWKTDKTQVRSSAIFYIEQAKPAPWTDSYTNRWYVHWGN